MAADISHLTSLFENATEGIILTNSAGNIVLVNPAAERMFGYNSGEIIGRPIEILIPDHVKLQHNQLREGFYKNPSNRVMGHGRDLYGKTKDGTNLPVEVSLSFYKKNKEVFVIAFIVDITKRKEIETNMVNQQKELENVSGTIQGDDYNTAHPHSLFGGYMNEKRTLFRGKKLEHLQLRFDYYIDSAVDEGNYYWNGFTEAE